MAPPKISSHTWWCHVITEASLGKVGLPKFPELKAAASKLFSGAGNVDTRLLWGFISMLAEEMKTAAVNARKANFHAQITETIHREHIAVGRA